MRLFVQELDYEISGMGKAHFDKEIGAWVVTEVRIFEQEVSAGTTDLEGEDIAKFATSLIENDESLEEWCLWWHSHNSMGVFWSGTDTNTMNENPFSSEYMLSIVTNNKEEYKARLDIYSPCHVHVDNIPVQIAQPTIPKKIKEYVTKEVKNKVKIKSHLTKDVKPEDNSLLIKNERTGAWERKPLKEIAKGDIKDEQGKVTSEELSEMAEKIASTAKSFDHLIEVLDPLYLEGTATTILIADIASQIYIEKYYDEEKEEITKQERIEEQRAAQAVQGDILTEIERENNKPSNKYIKKESLKLIRDYADSHYMEDKIIDELEQSITPDMPPKDFWVYQAALDRFSQNKIPKDVKNKLEITEQEYNNSKK